MLFAGCSFCRGTGEEQPELFRDKDRNNIVKQNEKYVQESAMQRTKQLDRVLEEALDHIRNMAYWVENSMDSPEVKAEQLQEMTDNSAFDYVRFTDANGINMAADGRTNDATDRKYFQNGRAGKTGMSVTERSRITNETLVNFYTPLRYHGEIIGVLRGVYLADRHMKSLLETSFFGVEASTYLCSADGTVISGS